MSSEAANKPEQFDTELAQEIKDLKEAAQNKPQAPPVVKHEWYQTESAVTVAVLAKNLNAEKLNISCTEKQLNIVAKDLDSLNINFHFNLAHPIKPDQTQVKFLSTKLELKMIKVDAIHWKTLELDPNEVPLKQPSVAPVPKDVKPTYPTSSKSAKNWDKIAKDVEAEEKDEKLEGDAALNKLFQSIYRDGSDEVRRAMNKSFSESGGTVLSTNWGDVAKGKQEVKAPDGMEWKKWD